MQTFNQLFFKKKQIFSYFFKEISELNAPYYAYAYQASPGKTIQWSGRPVGRLYCVSGRPSDGAALYDILQLNYQGSVVGSVFLWIKTEMTRRKWS